MIEPSTPAAKPAIPRTPPHPGETPKGESLLSRRQFIRNFVRGAVALTVIPGVLTQLLPAVPASGLAGGGAGPVVRRDPKTNGKIPITIDDLAGNPPVVVTAEWSFLPAVVYKVKKANLEASSKMRGYNTAQFAVQHPTEPDNAIMLYQGKCKHLGCTVGFSTLLGGSKDVEDYDGDGINDGRILCPCHQGQYDIYDNCKNVPGTPPPAPLDVIRFNVDNFSDPDEKIPSATNAIIGAELLPQNAYRDADKKAGDSLVGATAYNLGSQAAKKGA